MSRKRTAKNENQAWVVSKKYRLGEPDVKCKSLNDLVFQLMAGSETGLLVPLMWIVIEYMQSQDSTYEFFSSSGMLEFGDNCCIRVERLTILFKQYCQKNSIQNRNVVSDLSINSLFEEFRLRIVYETRIEPSTQIHRQGRWIVGCQEKKQ